MRELVTGQVVPDPDLAEGAVTTVEIYHKEGKAPTHGDLGEFFQQLSLEIYQKALTPDIRRIEQTLPAGNVLSHRGIIRHVQLKASYALARTAYQTVQLALAEKPSGCVIWLRFDPETLNLGPFLWLGGRPGEPLPNIGSMPVAKHAKGNAQGVKKERPNLRQVRKASFSHLETMKQVILQLFGASPP